MHKYRILFSLFTLPFLNLIAGAATTEAELTTESASANANTSGTYTITLSNDIAYTGVMTPLGSDTSFAIPSSMGNITLDGGDFTLSTTGSNRGLFCGAGDSTNSITSKTITILDLTISGAKAIGGTGGKGEFTGGGGAGMGGGLFVGNNTSVVINNVTFTDCIATGGNGGQKTTQTVKHGGGGGGMKGHGGDAFYVNGGTGTGGGGGGFGQDGQDATAIAGGTGGGIGFGANAGLNGALGGTTSNAKQTTAPDGGSGGGGGGGGPNGNPGGMGGFGAGSGGSSSGNYEWWSGQNAGFGGGTGGAFEWGAAGFGGGSGGGQQNPAPAGFAGGKGNSDGFGGGGGALGGAIFIQAGGSLEIQQVAFSGSAITPGAGGTGTNNEVYGNPGEAHGIDIFMESGGNITFNIAADYTLANPIVSDGNTGAGGSFTKSGTATLTLPTNNTFTGGVTMSAGKLSISDDTCLGNSTINPSMGGGTLLASDTFSTSRNYNLTGNGTFEVASGKIFTLGGVLSGVGTFIKSGSGDLVLPGGNTYSGGATFSGGTTYITEESALGNASINPSFNGGTLNFGSTLTTDRNFNMASGGGTVDVDTALVLTIDGQITGTGAFTKTGTGNLILNGDSSGVSHTTTLSGGTTYIHGAMRGNLTVDSGATLSGNGSVGTIAANNGRVAPGASIGTLTVTGDYTPGANGVLEIEVSPTANDVLSVTGTATLTNSDVEFVLTHGAYNRNHNFTFLDADTVTGTFAVKTDNISESLNVDYFTTTVLVTLPNGAAIPPLHFDNLTGNEKAVAQYLFGLHVGNPGDALFTLRHDLVKLPNIEQYRAALLHLSPVQFGTLSTLSLRNADHVFDSLAFPQFYCESSELFYYATPFYSNYSQDIDGQQYGFDSHTGGFTTGVNYTNEDFITVGGMAGYSHSYQKWQQNAGSSSINGFYLGTYVGYNENGFAASIAPMFIYQHYDTRRHVEFTGVNETALAEFHSLGGGAHMEIRTTGTFKTSLVTFDVTPKVSLDAVGLWQEKFKEHGGNSVNLHGNSQAYGVFSPEFILGFSGTFEVPYHFYITPYVGGGIKSTHFLGRHTLTSGLQITPDFTHFVVDTFNDPLLQGVFEANLSAVRCQSLTMDLGYEFNKGSGADNHMLELKFGYNY